MIKEISKVFRLSMIYSVGSIFEKSLYFLLIPIYTTYLSTADYGIVSIMSITVGVFIQFIFPPLNQGLVRFYYSPDHEGKRGVLVFNLFFFLFIQAIICALIMYLANHLIAEYVLSDEKLHHIVSIYAIILFFQPLSAFFLSLLRIQEKAKYYVFVSWSKFIFSALFILYGLIYLKLGVFALIYGNLLGVALSVFLVLPTFFKLIKPELSLSALGPPLKYGYPLIINGLSLLIIQSSDQYVLKIFTELSVVGLYGFSYKFAEILYVILITPLWEAFKPSIFKKENDVEELKIFVSKSCTYFYIIGMFFCLLLSVFIKDIIQILVSNKAFTAGWNIVHIIAFSFLLHGIGYFFNYGMIMQRKTYHMSSIILIAAIINIGLNFIFVPLWGISGAAYATLISYLIWNFLKIYLSAKLFNLHFELVKLLKITIIGMILYILSLLFTGGDSLLTNMGIKILIVLCYPLYLMIFFFDPQEKKYLWNLGFIQK